MTRLHNLIRKVGSEETGLKAAFHIHVEHTLCDGVTCRIRISTPGKFENEQIEKILRATEAQINDALNEIVGEGT